uniref:Alpha,alpha-trehalose-phosphate synthase (UDP-forming) n=1 Tax=Percolomonas cosmopolitus TaxID=63605 RepID=A0A7S1KSR2_9EUKA|mmetsp:Transcript_7509/g.28183  ORF Transcript_7509/g.28183 Transcript_7509/m.28183 type:complete len:758 (+) Transcript_7509:560-2833(+)|eukprot:CAMPEP_0117445896 /NCGR_PEP_ID=MMETSP0759-20121206/6045_1 /TAXON_ID=63605 /ORGANISM="Percolomonas cosmopolitus, Strain WS" /LENGTH=757 /DNA_ID=CAMNT_0005238113 /DNA_START=528 /DNA_END=2801 /DNA_ORIENTATION=+
MSLIIASNRLPANFSVDPNGEMTYSRSSGGLVTALTALGKPFKWIGSLPKPDTEEIEETVKEKFQNKLSCFPIFLEKKLEEEYYNGFSNGVLWPLFHYMVEKEIEFHKSFYFAYREVNEIFAAKIAEAYQEGDTVWIHDYHLCLVPEILRKQFPDMSIGFFLHIPFPSSEIYRALPVREHLLKGLLGADMIAFHTYDFARHFLSSCSRILGLETTQQGVYFNGRMRYVKTLPIGIDPQKFQEEVKSAQCQAKIVEFRQQYKNKKIILGIDRVDYSKGIPLKFSAFEQFLKDHPDMAKEVVLVQVGVPSRTDVKEYKKLIKEINTQVGRIQSNFGSVDSFGPLLYINKSVEFTTLSALYTIADACIISSIRDGMNLVSSEYVACQEEGKKNGVLILSEFAGASRSLCGSLIVNPFDVEQTANAFYDALHMKEEERLERHARNFEIVSSNTAVKWGNDFLSDLKSCTEISKNLSPRKKLLDAGTLKEFYQTSTKANGKRWFFLDYDGTIVKISQYPMQARPTDKLVDVLQFLLKDPKNVVYVFSGRHQTQLDDLLGHVKGLGLVSESGLATKHPHSGEWVNLYKEEEVDIDWMQDVKKICKWFVSRTPGSQFEERSASCAFHYRNTDQEYGRFQVYELQQHLEESFKTKPLDIIQGKKVLELRPHNINKGRAARMILEQHHIAHPEEEMYVFCAGDGGSDEFMFLAVNDLAKSRRICKALTVAIRGFSDIDKASNADYILHRQEDIIKALSSLQEHGQL